MNDQSYENLTFDGNQVTGTGGREVPNPRFLGVSLQERPGFQITFDFFINVSVLKLFSLEASVPIADLTRVLGINVQTGPFAQTLSSPIGGGPRVAADFIYEQDRLIAPAPVEVILEPVEAVG